MSQENAFFKHKKTSKRNKEFGIDQYNMSINWYHKLSIEKSQRGEGKFAFLWFTTNNKRAL